MPSLEYKALLDEAWDLHVRKNAGYAGADNPDPWANFRMCEAFGITAFEGCMVRLSDKYIRVTNLMRSADNDQVGESIKDTLMDLQAYALIAICLLNEEHRGTEENDWPDHADMSVDERPFTEQAAVGTKPNERNGLYALCGLTPTVGTGKCTRAAGHRGICYGSDV